MESDWQCDYILTRLAGYINITALFMAGLPLGRDRPQIKVEFRIGAKVELQSTKFPSRVLLYKIKTRTVAGTRCRYARCRWSLCSYV